MNEHKQELVIPVVLFGLRLPGSRMIEEFNYAVGLQDLDIIFKATGDVYRYYNVPMPVVMAMYSAAMHGESVGAFFNAQIKDVYQYDKIS
jgi:hypothetical protein